MLESDIVTNGEESVLQFRKREDTALLLILCCRERVDLERQKDTGKVSG